MFSEDKYIIVPKSLIDDNKNYIEEILPLFCFLQIRKGIDHQCMASLKILLEECGYSYSNTRRSQFISRIIEALRILKRQHYISNFFNMNYEEIQDIGGLNLKELFYVEINSTVANFTGGNGYTKLTLDVYEKMRYVTRNKNGVSYWRMLYLYLYLINHMYHYSDRFKQLNSKNCEVYIQTHPEYCRYAVDNLCEEINNTISISTIKKIIKIFNDLQILMSESVKITVHDLGDNSTVRSIGTVFVQYSDYWQIEMNAAIADAKKHYKKIYKIKEDVTK